MRRGHFQVQQNHVQLSHLLLELPVRRTDECVRGSQNCICILGYALQAFDHVLQIVHVGFERIGERPELGHELPQVPF